MTTLWKRCDPAHTQLSYRSLTNHTSTSHSDGKDHHVTAAAGLAGLTKINFREQAVASLRSATTSGQLPPQTPMVETELSERLQISRGTLREAMRRACSPLAPPVDACMSAT